MFLHHFNPFRANAAATVSRSERFIIDVMFVFRAASLLTYRSDPYGVSHWYEPGPYGILERLRTLIGMHFDEKGRAFPENQPNELAKVFICMWCSSVWIGVIYAVLTGRGVGYGLSLSTGAILIETYLRKK